MEFPNKVRPLVSSDVLRTEQPLKELSPIELTEEYIVTELIVRQFLYASWGMIETAIVTAWLVGGHRDCWESTTVMIKKIKKEK